MAKLTRITGKTFGETATATGNDPQIGQFGSALAGTYVGTTDIPTIQGLSAWSNGFIDAVTPTNQYPPLPEMTGALKVLSYQENYILQQGIPEWDSATNYYENGFCSYEGVIYKSLTDDNLNNQPDISTADWSVYGANSDYANQSLSNLNTTGERRVLPSQSGNSGKYLTTNGTSPSWVTITFPRYMPDYSQGVSITATQTLTPSKDSYLIWYKPKNINAGTQITIYLGSSDSGYEITHSAVTSTYGGVHQYLFIPLVKNQTYYIYLEGTFTCKYYPIL